MQKFKENCKLNNRGFTLIEMVVTVAIISIFAGIVLRITTGAEKSEILQKSRKILKKSNCAVNNNPRRKFLKLCRD